MNSHYVSLIQPRSQACKLHVELLCRGQCEISCHFLLWIYMKIEAHATNRRNPCRHFKVIIQFSYLHSFKHTRNQIFRQFEVYMKTDERRMISSWLHSNPRSRRSSPYPFYKVLDAICIPKYAAHKAMRLEPFCYSWQILSTTGIMPPIFEAPCFV